MLRSMIERLIPRRRRHEIWTLHAHRGDAEPHGFGRWFHTDGSTVRVQCVWNRGFVEGFALVYFPSGNLEIEGYFRRGLPHGKCTAYDSNGWKRFEGVYKHGYMHRGCIYRPGNILEYRGNLRRIEGRRFRVLQLSPRDDITNGDPDGHPDGRLDEHPPPSTVANGSLNRTSSQTTTLDVEIVSPNTGSSHSNSDTSDDTDTGGCNDASLCVFCLQELLRDSYAFMPCGHNVVCVDCATTCLDQWLSECPVCREGPETSTLTRIHRM